MSWDRPSGGDDNRPDRYDKGLDKNGERPFPGAPLDRPPAAPPTGPLPDWEEIKERRKAIPDHRDYARASASGYFDSDEWKNRKANAANEATAAKSEKAQERASRSDSGGRGQGAVDGPAAAGTDRNTDAPEKADKPEPAGKNAEQVKELASDLKHTKAALTETRNELRDTKSELKTSNAERSKLIDTNSSLVRENQELRAEMARSSIIDRKNSVDAAQDNAIEAKTRRKNWFPTDKMSTFGGAAVTAAGAAAVYTHHMSPGVQAVAVAGTGAGVAGIGLGREIVDKINGWRGRRAASRADRSENQ